MYKCDQEKSLDALAEATIQELHPIHELVDEAARRAGRSASVADDDDPRVVERGDDEPQANTIHVPSDGHRVPKATPLRARSARSAPERATHRELCHARLPP